MVDSGRRLSEYPNVFVIDDNEADQFLCEHALEQYDSDIKITKVFNGKEALTALSSLATPPDLIFLDINMPCMNGFEFLDHYHRFDGDLSYVILMMTMSIDSDEAERGLSYPQVKKVVAKPLSESIVAECFSLLK